MATYRLHEKSYLPTPRGISMVFEAGAEVSVPDDLVPGPHMEPVDDKARVAFLKCIDKRTGEFRTPKPRAVDEGPLAIFNTFDFKKLMEEPAHG